MINELIDRLVSVLAIAAIAYFSFSGIADEVGRKYIGLDAITYEEVQR